MTARLALALLLLATPARAAVVEQVQQSTQGWCSPAVSGTGGNVTIVCMGVDPRAMDRLNELLDKKDLELADKVRQAEEWARRYHALEDQLAELKAQPAGPGDGGDLAGQAEAALSRGELDTAGALLDKSIAQQEAQRAA